MPEQLITRLILAVLLGAFVGLEREIHEKHEPKNLRSTFLGIRTFTLITVLGGIAGLLYGANPVLFAILSLAILTLVIVYYIFDSHFTRDYGITTELALFFSYVIGILLITDIIPLYVLVGLTIFVVFILSRKKFIQKNINTIGQAELGSFISYLVIALVILPLFPDRAYYLSDIPQLTNLLSITGINTEIFAKLELINPYKVWRIVALITGVDVFGYILERNIGRKSGWILTSLIGGFISSTATTQSLAQQSKKNKTVNHLVSAAILSNVSSFIQEAIILLPLSGVLFIRTVPTLFGMIIGGLFCVIYFLLWKQNHNVQSSEITQKAIRKSTLFNLRPAIKFAILFLSIKLISQIALLTFGSNGYLVSVGFGALTGMDAILVSLAELSGNILSFDVAVLAFIFANTINLSMKSVYCFTQGSREFAFKFTLGIGVILLSGLLFYTQASRFIPY